MDGGILAAPGGSIAVESIASGQLDFEVSDRGFVFSRENQTLSDITLQRQALIEASGVGETIQLRGRNITISDGSAVLV